MERMISIGFSLVVLLTILQSSKCEDYLVAVAYRGKYAYIWSTAGETGGLVEIQYPHLASRASGQFGPFGQRSYRLLSQVTIYGDAMHIFDPTAITSGVENAAIIVSRSDEDIDIVVHADGVFSPLPISALGTKYILPSSLAPDSYYRSLLLIATHNTSTTVDIFFRINRGSIRFAYRNYIDGDVLSLKLNPYQTFRISTSYDLNGTVINSEHNLAVFFGIEYSYKCTVNDQLLPVKHYGQEYVVAVDDTKLDLQIISEDSHVQITFSSGATVSTGERRLYNRSLERGESLHFTATRPVLVTLSRADGYSSAFTTVPPVYSYVTHRGVRLLYNNLRVKLKILTDRRATVLIKHKDANDLLTWRDIAGSGYKVGTLVQSQSQYIYDTFISSDFPFTALSFYNGSVYNSGYNVSAEEPVHYTGQTYLVALAGNIHSSAFFLPRILATAGETGGQWQVQNPHTGRVWSRRFNPYNTDYFYSQHTDGYSVVVVLVRDDAVQIKGELNSYTSFSPLPVSALGTKYIMSSCLLTGDLKWDITVLVIVTHSKKADIDIIFRLDGNVTYDSKTYTDGETLSVRLDRYQAFSLNSSSDMTRTIVKSTEKIAVYSGTYRVRSIVFITFEQLLPVKHYGHEYILAIQDPNYRLRSYDSATPYRLQVVTDHSDTHIMFSNGSSVSMGEHGVVRKQFGSPETFYFNTTRPVMATLCTVGRFSQRPALVVVPPVSLYSKLTTQEIQGTLQIVTDQENNNVEVHQTHHSFSTVFSHPIQWKNVSGTRFKVGTLGAAGLATTIRSNSTFAVLGYSYYIIDNGGYNFRTHPDAETSAPDGSGVKLNKEGSSHETSTPDGSGVKVNKEGSTHAGSSNNAAVIVGVVCGIVILALLVAFVAYVFYTRRKTIPVTRPAEQDPDAPQTSMNIYAVPDRATAGENTYSGLRFNSTSIDNDIIDSTETYMNFEGGK